MPRDGRTLSRRDYRTQPGVLTPGSGPPKRVALKGHKISVRPRGLRRHLNRNDRGGNFSLPPLQGGGFLGW
jgi:hypothetical protein